MKNSIYFLIISLLILAGCSSPAHEEKKEVYVCTSSSASTFHRSDSCSALKRCNDEILFVSLEKAKEHKRKPCKICKKAAKTASEKLSH